ncbi:MAG: hypothetical protein RR458_04660 [Clostridia bacterium]
MVNSTQFKASFKKEWLEIVRENKLLSYLLLALGFMTLNMVFQTAFETIIFSNWFGEKSSMSNWYFSQASFNSFLLGINMIVVLFLNRNVVTRELTEKKLAVPLSLGLKASINITAKMLMQVLVPSAIALFASLANACLTALFLKNTPVVLGNFGVVSIGFSTMIYSALCVFVTMVIMMTVLLALQALIRNANIALILTLVILLLGDNLADVLGVSAFTPVAFYSYAMQLASAATLSQMVLSSLITISVVILTAVAGVLVYTDRNDFAL